MINRKLYKQAAWMRENNIHKKIMQRIETAKSISEKGLYMQKAIIQQAAIQQVRQTPALLFNHNGFIDRRRLRRKFRNI